MFIHDDADMDKIVRTIVETLNECARHIGKADRTLDNGQIAEIEAAIEGLRRMIDLKRT